MKIFISGGAKNGKSMYAQIMAKEMSDEKGLPLYYVATMEPTDHEDEKRIEKHVEERAGWGFSTIEEPLKLSAIFEGNSNANSKGVFLVDSLTAILMNNMFRPTGEINPDCAEEMWEDIKKFSEIAENIIFVSDSIASDGFIFDDLTEGYKENLAKLERKVAKFYDQVYEVTAGQLVRFK